MALVKSVSHFGDNSTVKYMLGVDRLDYTKGIPHRILAFQHLLQTHPELAGKVGESLKQFQSVV